jgi:hypothetical protein
MHTGALARFSDLQLHVACVSSPRPLNRHRNHLAGVPLELALGFAVFRAEADLYQRIV